jgi:hypothetical protein
VTLVARGASTIGGFLSDRVLGLSQDESNAARKLEICYVLGFDRATVLAGQLYFLGKHAEVLSDVHERRALVVQFEFNAANIASAVTAAILEVLDRHFGKRGCLIPRQLRGVAIGPGLHVIHHVGETDLSELQQDGLDVDLGSLGGTFLNFLDLDSTVAVANRREASASAARLLSPSYPAMQYASRWDCPLAIPRAKISWRGISRTGIRLGLR